MGCLPLLMSCTDAQPPLKIQYVLSPEMVVNESGCGYGSWIADEQGKAHPQTIWKAYQKEICKEYAASLILRLGQQVHITDIHVFAESELHLKIAVFQKPGNQEKSFSLQAKSGWNKLSLQANAAYVQLQVTQGDGIGEVLLETDKHYTYPTVAEIPAHKPLMNDFIGTNAFVDVPLGLLEPFGCVREYHDWPDWNEPQRDSISLDQSKAGFDFQLFYANLHKSGKLAVPVIQKSPKWLTEMLNNQSRPVPKGANREDPTSYQRHGYFLQRYAANFSKEEKGAVHYYENWNEPDKWWEYGVSYFTPYQYASMSSASKDGHLLSMGTQTGIANGDKAAKLVMAGLANPKIDYLNALHYWCDVHRKGNFAWDVVNFHFYGNSCGLPDNEPKSGISPETANLYQKTKAIVAFRNRNAPNSQVWITEFGYDTEKSPQQSQAIGAKTAEQVQADWIIRSFALLSATGVDKAFQYMIRDFGKEGFWATSGLYSSTIKAKPYVKPSWNYIHAFRWALDHSVFEKLEVDSANLVYKVWYQHATDPSLKTLVLWKGTADGTEIADYQWHGGKSVPARAIALSSTNPCGEPTPLTSSTKVQVSETPLIIQQQPQGKFSPCTTLAMVNPSDIACTDQDGVPQPVLLDEQKEEFNPAMGTGNTAYTTFWKSPYGHKGKKEISFDLKSNKNIHSIYLFDGAGTGEIAVSIQTHEGWKTVGKLQMDLYNKWKSIAINSQTKQIRLEKISGNADVGEAILYENITK